MENGGVAISMNDEQKSNLARTNAWLAGVGPDDRRRAANQQTDLILPFHLASGACFGWQSVGPGAFLPSGIMELRSLPLACAAGIRRDIVSETGNPAIIWRVNDSSATAPRCLCLHLDTDEAQLKGSVQVSDRCVKDGSAAAAAILSL